MGIKLLLDTHALVWWWTDDLRLPAAARAAIAEPSNLVHVSAVSAWEIATKYRVGKWPEVQRILADFPALVRRSRFATLAVSADHAQLAGSLDSAHRDPFDRMLIAQAQLDGLTLVTADAVFAAHSVAVLWDAAR